MELLEEGLLSFQRSAVPDLRGGCSTLPVFSRRSDDYPMDPYSTPTLVASVLFPLPAASSLYMDDFTAYKQTVVPLTWKNVLFCFV